MGSFANKIHGGVELIRVCKDWPRWFAEYAQSSNDQEETWYRMRCGVTLHTRRNRSDLHMIDENWAFRKYEYFGFDVKPGEVVVDIGGNIGTFAVYAAAVRKASRVIVFEPHPANFAMLKKNVESNGLTMVTCVQEAVSGERGQAILVESANNFGGHSMTKQSANGQSNVFEVQCCALEDVFERFHIDRIDYLKIDCEGAEYEILESASDSVYDRIGRVSMEYHTRNDRRIEELGEHFARHGFHFRYFDNHRIYASREPIA